MALWGVCMALFGLFIALLNACMAFLAETQT